MHPSVRKARRNAKTARAIPMLRSHATRVRATDNFAGKIKALSPNVSATREPKIVLFAAMARRRSRDGPTLILVAKVRRDHRRRRIVAAISKVRGLTGRAGDRECQCALRKWSSATMRRTAIPARRSVPTGCAGIRAA